MLGFGSQNRIKQVASATVRVISATMAAGLHFLGMCHAPSGHPPCRGAGAASLRPSSSLPASPCAPVARTSVQSPGPASPSPPPSRRRARVPRDWLCRHCGAQLLEPGEAHDGFGLRRLRQTRIVSVWCEGIRCGGLFGMCEVCFGSERSVAAQSATSLHWRCGAPKCARVGSDVTHAAAAWIVHEGALDGALVRHPQKPRDRARRQGRSVRMGRAKLKLVGSQCFVSSPLSILTPSPMLQRAPCRALVAQ